MGLEINNNFDPANMTAEQALALQQQLAAESADRKAEFEEQKLFNQTQIEENRAQINEANTKATAETTAIGVNNITADAEAQEFTFTDAVVNTAQLAVDTAEAKA